MPPPWNGEPCWFIPQNRQFYLKLPLSAIYGTQRDWTKLTNADFRQTSAKDVVYVEAHKSANFKANNVLYAIDKLEKRLLPRLRVWLGLGLRRLAEGLLGGKAKAGHRF
jgi:hypothetical protein